jgi:beta-N-acetylhexosaminidase
MITPLVTLALLTSPLSTVHTAIIPPELTGPVAEGRAAPGSSAADREAAAWVDSAMARLTLREKVAQMAMPWLPGGMPARGSAEWKRARQFVVEQKVGGLIVGKGSARGTAGWLNELQDLSDLPILVGADLEWGPGTRLEGATVLPINMAITAAGRVGYAHEAGRITALEARAAGIHMIFAPVADVNINPLNPVINTRSYGADPIEVAERVASFIEGVREGGALSVAKHFPGHGDTELDSLLTLPTVTAPRPRLNLVELVPFRAAIAARVDGIMTAHLEVPALEPAGLHLPATLSPAVLTKLLRGEMRFQGLIITDGLMMDGVRRGRTAGEVAVGAVRAGADILLMPPALGDAIDAVVAAVEAGELEAARIDHSVRRILLAKAAAGLHRDRLTNPARWTTDLGAPAHQEWAERIAAESLTLVRQAAGGLPHVAGRRVLAIVYDDAVRTTTGDPLRRALEQRSARISVMRLSRNSKSAAIREAERAAGRADVVVFASFARSVPWKGALGIPASISTLANRLAGQGATVISFGDPYLLRQIPRAQNYLLAWSETEIAQRAAARALVGEISISGRLPIPLPPSHALGDGIFTPALAAAAAGAEVLGETLREER